MQNHDVSLIPLQWASGQVEFIDAATLWIHQYHFILKFNKRGNLRRAFEKPRDTLAPLTHDGEGFRQALNSGFVFALRGTRGSQSSRVIGA